ncbi:uncharacterized protein LOC117167103 [Belonocnema kinseyi]|uniref:uncharacterized protein LOC117167103 n=1 Tax=Belonocnema kinseyi TaxID=2817044 RepID=UPI00143DBAF0|nr:uncharacterized protein LOC117167103 [Belonocnema kinseyi]XP_033207640.1 uncharacterized protein LOC117167103 [Belonocnema kinseyi]
MILKILTRTLQAWTSFEQSLSGIKFNQKLHEHCSKISLKRRDRIIHIKNKNAWKVSDEFYDVLRLHFNTIGRVFNNSKNWDGQREKRAVLQPIKPKPQNQNLEEHNDQSEQKDEEETDQDCENRNSFKIVGDMLMINNAFQKLFEACWCSL